MKRLNSLIKIIALIAFAAAIIDQLRRDPDQRTWTGNVLFIPYDFRPPTGQRLQERWWNPDDQRLLTPHTWGVGWSVNLYQLRERLLALSR